MTPNAQIVARAIDRSPYNRGLVGADWVRQSGNIPITFPNGDILLFEADGDGGHECHLLCKEGGRASINNAREAFRQMFEEHGATFLYGLAPEENRKARLFTRWTGARSRGRRHTPDGFCELFYLTPAMLKGLI